MLVDVSKLCYKDLEEVLREAGFEAFALFRSGGRVFVRVQPACLA